MKNFGEEASNHLGRLDEIFSETLFAGTFLEPNVANCTQNDNENGIINFFKVESRVSESCVGRNDQVDWQTRLVDGKFCPTPTRGGAKM
jgi:hypothetical protein